MGGGGDTKIIHLIQKQMQKPEENNERIELKESQYTISARCFEIITKSSSQPCHGMLQ